MQLRVIQSTWDKFIAHLCERSDVETAGVVLAERLRGNVLLAKHLLVVPPEGYQIRQPDRVRIDPIAVNQLVRVARDEGLSVLTIHTHPGTTQPWFSAADDAGDERLIPSLFAQMPGPHGSLVIAGESREVLGRCWTSSGDELEVNLQVVGLSLGVARKRTADELAPCFSRQTLALGEAGQETLRHLHVGVVGVGGTGSVVFGQLAHLGVGRITVIDPDVIEQSNVSRVLGASLSDVGATSKVNVAVRYARALGLSSEVRAIQGAFGTAVQPDEVEDADVLFSCVDCHSPRAVLNRLAYSKAIPLFDMGSGFRVNTHGALVAAAGRVVVVGPGRPCLACWGHLDADRLRTEATPPTERDALIAAGYIEGASAPQPSVIAFNTAIAGAAVVEFLRMVTGFASESPPMRLNFDFMSGVVSRNRLAGRPECSICGQGLR